MELDTISTEPRPAAGGVLVGDEVSITLDVELVRES